jgi:RNA polymerase sigma-70 factor (ECF subfamily)
MVALSGIIPGSLWRGQCMEDFSALRFPAFPLENEERTNSPQSISTQNEAGGVEDEALLCRMGQGDREACSCLFRRYSRPVRNVGRRILRDDAESDDLVQEVFLYLYKKWSLFDVSKGSARSWIFQVAYTHAFIRRRHLKSIGFYASDIAVISVRKCAADKSGCRL